MSVHCAIVLVEQVIHIMAHDIRAKFCMKVVNILAQRLVIFSSRTIFFKLVHFIMTIMIIICRNMDTVMNY